MKNIFDNNTRAEILQRIQTLDKDKTPVWGKMSVYQMVRHCTKWEEMLLGKTMYRQSLLGRLFGKMALKNMLNDAPIKQNLPTIPSFKITGIGDFDNAKSTWIRLIQEHAERPPAGFVHPFFGALTVDQAGQMDYKHIDHHLRQFGC